MIMKHFPHLPTRFKMMSPVFEGIPKMWIRQFCARVCTRSPVWPLKTYLLNCFQHIQKFTEWFKFNIK